MDTTYYDNIIKTLRNENCIGPHGWLAIWPAWLSWQDVQGMVKNGLMTYKFYQHLYGHTDYYIV